jgi:serine/threonine protein kinase
LLSLDGGERAAFTTSRRLPTSLANATVKIADFGIAKAISDSGSTLTNAFSGTPGYMAPEQFRGEMPGPETDVYALGIVTRELCVLQDAHPAVSQVVAKATSAARSNRFRPPIKPARRGLNLNQRLALASLLAVFGAGLIVAITTSRPHKICWPTLRGPSTTATMAAKLASHTCMP